MDYLIKYGSIAAVQEIAADDAQGGREWSAIYCSPGKVEIYPAGNMRRDVLHSFPAQVRAVLSARFDTVFSHPIETRGAAVADMRALPPVTVESLPFTRINNDTNGNPRFVVHFLNCLPETARALQFSDKYPAAVRAMNAIGGRKYHTRAYGGGIVFQSYSVDELARDIGAATGRVFYPVID